MMRRWTARLKAGHPPIRRIIWKAFWVTAGCNLTRLDRKHRSGWLSDCGKDVTLTVSEDGFVDEVVMQDEKTQGRNQQAGTQRQGQSLGAPSDGYYTPQRDGKITYTLGFLGYPQKASRIQKRACRLVRFILCRKNRLPDGYEAGGIHRLYV